MMLSSSQTERLRSFDSDVYTGFASQNVLYPFALKVFAEVQSVAKLPQPH